MSKARCSKNFSEMVLWRRGELAGNSVTASLRRPFNPNSGSRPTSSPGDKNPDDHELGTFNPLFPRGKYFGALSPIGPRNLIQVRPTITVYPQKDIVVSLTGGAYWRQSTADGIYGIAGNLVRSGKGSDARFIEVS